MKLDTGGVIFFLTWYSAGYHNPHQHSENHRVKLKAVTIQHKIIVCIAKPRMYWLKNLEIPLSNNVHVRICIYIYIYIYIYIQNAIIYKQWPVTYNTGLTVIYHILIERMTALMCEGSVSTVRVVTSSADQCHSLIYPFQLSDVRQ